MLLQKSDIVKGLLIFAWFIIDFDEAFVLFEFLEFLFCLRSTMIYIWKIAILQNFAFELAEFAELLRYHYLIGFMLSLWITTLQMGQLLFLFIALIL